MHRLNRANELAQAITEWNYNKTNQSYLATVCGIGIDAVFGRTIFVPSSLDEDGDIKAIGPADENGNRYYVCHIDIPEQFEYGCAAYTELALFAFLQMVIDDGKAMGAAFNLNSIRIIVSKEMLADLIQKIGMLQRKENDNETETK